MFSDIFANKDVQLYTNENCLRNEEEIPKHKCYGCDQGDRFGDKYITVEKIAFSTVEFGLHPVYNLKGRLFLLWIREGG